MIGQQLPQTNEKCYSILQCLMWLFAFFFPPSKHSPGGRGRRTGTVAVARWTCETGAFCLAWLDHQHRPRVWRWLPARLGHAPLRLIRVGTRRREYTSLQILICTHCHVMNRGILPCTSAPNFACSTTQHNTVTRLLHAYAALGEPWLTSNSIPSIQDH